MMKNCILGGTQRAENAEVRFFEMVVIPTGRIKDICGRSQGKVRERVEESYVFYIASCTMFSCL